MQILILGRCPKCGLSFAFSQDVTRHTRDNKCTENKEESEPNATVVKKEWKCETCHFSTDSQAELIFHKALHAGTVQTNKDEDENNDKSSVKYICLLCKKSFTKVSLRNHIRSHTGERPFSCNKCPLTFSRRTDLNAHHRSCMIATRLGLSNENQRKRNFVCSECNDAFYTK